MRETESPTVTATAAHFGPSSAMAHNDSNMVRPSTSARPSRSRESGTRSASRRFASPDSKYRICQRSAPVTASSIAITDWKY
jgi:hypothetical protein